MLRDSARLPANAPDRGAQSARVRRFGALPERGGVRFRVIAPEARDLRVTVSGGAAPGIYRLDRDAAGAHECFVRGAGAGDTYVYSVDGSDARPDPASRFQPEGPHGCSQVIDPDAYRWRNQQWTGRNARDLTIYELHVGTFTTAGTFAAARERLTDLRDLGITAIELMPIAEFAGRWNWGYDGVSLYAPTHNYGHPDDLRAFVDAAHGLGLAVLLDVVYNHLGPEGAYLTQFHPGYITDRHATPWGGAVALDGAGSDLVRAFLIDNATHWIREYRLDGLRLDATHALIDDSPVHVVAELVAAVRAAAGWPVAIYAEDHRNLASLLDPAERGGWGLDGVWADDFHHIVRRRLAGDAVGYYQDFEGSTHELARTLRQGWLYTGQHSPHGGDRRGTDPSYVPMQRFVVCLQNHDQIGNRATGDRLHHAIDHAAWRAASTILLTAPTTPLLFMGQEWAASSPFQYFTDLEPELGRLVTEGRREEFKYFPDFADPGARERIPDPQQPATFERSRLNWAERAEPVHAASLALYTELLRLRQAHTGLGGSAAATADAAAVDDAIVLRREAPDNRERFIVVARLSGSGAVSLDGCGGAPPRLIFSTEEARFALDPKPPRATFTPGHALIEFQRPGAVILQCC